MARWFAARPHFVHIRTRARSPETNGVIERFFGSLKYEQLYRHDITNGEALADHVADYYLDKAVPQTTLTLNFLDPESEQDS